jgi:HlyD family secretion protein
MKTTSHDSRRKKIFSVPRFWACGLSAHRRRMFKRARRERTGCSVQVAPVEKKTIKSVVTAQAVLFPLAQSAIVPKINAPVKTFYVKRGSRVKAGELLATLEHEDLSAAATDTKGSYEQAQATYEISTGADLLKNCKKSELEVQAARRSLDAQQKMYDSRQELFQQGALPRKEFDQAGVDLTEAHNLYELAAKHLEAMQAIGKQQTLRSAAGQLESAKGKYLGAQAELSYSEISQPHQRSGRRPPSLSG